jgi:hypothetical protein
MLARTRRYGSTLIFPLRIAIQLRSLLRRKEVELQQETSGGDAETKTNLLEVLSPKFCYLIDNALYIVLLVIGLSLKPLPMWCEADDTNATVLLNTSMNIFNMTRRAAARSKTVVGGNTVVCRADVPRSAPWLSGVAGEEPLHGRNHWMGFGFILPPTVQLADRGCVDEYERNETFLEVIIVGWILSILVETLQRLRRRQLLATGLYGKSASLFCVLGIWDILDVLAVFFTLSACLAAACN